MSHKKEIARDRRGRGKVLVDMSRPAPRYTIEAATQEIARALKRRGRGSRKLVALGIGLTEQAFSAKMRGYYTRLDVDEIGMIAEVLDGPTGWPWVPWSEGERLDAAVPRARRGGHGHDPG